MRQAAVEKSATELLDLNDITGIDDLQAYLCDSTTITNAPMSFQTLCAATDKRKLVYISATQDVPVYFLQIFGVRSVPITADAVGETAAVDLVIVIDTSESMASEMPAYLASPGDFQPNALGGCNTTHTCEPLEQAKDAANVLVQNLFPGYDQVAVVTFDYGPRIIEGLSSELGNGGAVQTAIDGILLHDDSPGWLIKWGLLASSPGGVNVNGGFQPVFNPIFPDDRDGDGFDNDSQKTCVDEYVNVASSPAGGRATLGDHIPDMWDDLTGQPCDQDDRLDAYDWNRNGRWGQDDDDNLAVGETSDHALASGTTLEQNCLLSTCSGCGLRLATDVLKAGGRRNSTWVIVFLSDGQVNLSDRPMGVPDDRPEQIYGIDDIPDDFRYGFCGADPDTSFWANRCRDSAPGRYCIDQNFSTCPPDTTHVTESGPYSVEDYAFDMVDRAALLVSENTNEPRGEDIVIFSIGLGNAGQGENLLRYMANVGDEGARANDQCDGIPSLQNCGNYYYAPNASFLAQIFENIAGRIFTKISR